MRQLVSVKKKKAELRALRGALRDEVSYVYAGKLMKRIARLEKEVKGGSLRKKRVSRVKVLRAKKGKAA